MAEESREFLPPQPAGPEPELGAAPRPANPPPPSPPPAWSPPSPQAPPPSPQAPPTYGGWQQQQQPPPGYPPPGWQAPPPGWGYPQQPVQPDNGPAVAGFVLSLVSGGLLVLSAGLSSVISVGCAIFGIVYSNKGKKKVRTGETTKNRGLAQAGFVVGIVALCLSVLATLAWILVLADDEARRDLEREFDNSESIRATIQVGAAASRLLLA